jgi:hypothetical protein
MTQPKKHTDDKARDVPDSKHQRGGGLPQEETGGPGAAEKRRNQERDGQLSQERENQPDHKPRR